MSFHEFIFSLIAKSQFSREYFLKRYFPLFLKTRRLRRIPFFEIWNQLLYNLFLHWNDCWVKYMYERKNVEIRPVTFLQKRLEMSVYLSKIRKFPEISEKLTGPIQIFFSQRFIIYNIFWLCEMAAASELFFLFKTGI